MNIEKTCISLYFILLFLFLFTVESKGQESQLKVKKTLSYDIKTNLLYNATGSMNLGVEFNTGSNTTLDIYGSWNPWIFKNDRKWKHILIQPELRFWPKEVFEGHFWGIHAHYSFYNVSRLLHPPFSAYMEDHRFQGWLIGAGASYGYRWNVSNNWSMEATIGAGYAFLNYDKYQCGTCGNRLGRETKNYIGVTKAGVTLIYRLGTKKKSQRNEQLIYFVPPVIKEESPKEPIFLPSFILPEENILKQKKTMEKISISFVVGSAIIKPEYLNNDVRLKSIYRQLDSLSNNTEFKITNISIEGSASPEGAFDSNLALSERRAVSLKNHIQELYNLPDSVFTIKSKGEDWLMLDTLISKSNINAKSLILEVIGNDSPADKKEEELKQLSKGKVYLDMLQNIFPRLRKSDYQLNYTVLSTVKKYKEIFETNPSNLSLQELLQITNTYEKWEDNFFRIVKLSAELYPIEDIANINAAACALINKDADVAVTYLHRVKVFSGEYWNNTGILSYMNGDINDAKKYFDIAQKMNNPEAYINISRLKISDSYR